MKINNFKSLLENIEKKDFIIGHVVDEPEKRVKWIKLLPTEEHGSIVGIDVNGYWVINTGSGLEKILDDQSFWGLLPILEKPKIEFVSKLEVAIENKNLPRNIVQSFPFQKLISFALCTDMCSSYWKDLAVTWIEQSEELITDEVIECLYSITKSKGWPQKFKHRVKRLLKKMDVWESRF